MWRKYLNLEFKLIDHCSISSPEQNMVQSYWLPLIAQTPVHLFLPPSVRLSAASGSAQVSYTASKPAHAWSSLWEASVPRRHSSRLMGRGSSLTRWSAALCCSGGSEKSVWVWSAWPGQELALAQSPSSLWMLRNRTFEKRKCDVFMSWPGVLGTTM